MKSKKFKSVLCFSLLAFLCLGTSGCNNEEKIDPDPGIPPVDEPDDGDDGDTDTEPGEVIPDDNPDGGDGGDGDGGNEPEPDPTYNFDSAWVLVGDFADSSWDLAPSKDSIYYLAYDSTQPSSMYWERTITMGSADWAVGFRVCEYSTNNTWTTTIDYSNLASGSTGVSGPGTDNNIVAEAGTTYDLTIDATGSTPSILVKQQSESDDGDGDLGDDVKDVVVSKIDNIANNNDYILGADVSSLIEVEEAGGVFYDYDGNPVDCITYLAQSGINYARIRLWNDPYVTIGDPSSGSFQGGGNDLETDLKIAKRCVDAGMKVCLDIHYSDFWADPEKQVKPRTWSSYSGESLYTKAAEWTTEVLTAFTEAGCEPSMVQVGNEIQGPRVCGLTNSSEVYAFLAKCCDAVRTYNSEIKIVMHIPADKRFDSATLANYFNNFISNGVDYDVIGLSYYCYWHGSVSDFQSRIEYLDNRFDKDICVMEYSYGWTTKWEAGHGNMSNTFDSTCEADGGYEASVQGQASCIHDINEAVASTTHGIGTFYWEPAWLSLSGTSWASSNALNWWQTNVDPSATSSWFGTCSWANQALFNYDGRALASLKAYDYMRNGEENAEKYESGDLTFNEKIDAEGDRVAQLPEYATITTNIGRSVECEITWNSDDITKLETANNGDVVEMKGTITFGGETLEVTGTFTLYHEYLVNGSFEEGTSDRGIEATGWTLTGSGGRYRNNGSQYCRTGNFYYDPWLANAFECDLSQTIDSMSAGTYTFGMYWWTDSTLQMDNTLYVTVDESETTNQEFSIYVTEYEGWVFESLTFTVTNGQSVVVGLHTVGEAGAVAYMDDFTLYI